MKRIAPLLLLIAFAFAACQSTPQKQAVASLATLGQTVNQSYEGYLQAVLTGAAATNDVPNVTHIYRDFQSAFGVAAAAAHFATNTSLATPELYDLALKLSLAVNQLKGK